MKTRMSKVKDIMIRGISLFKSVVIERAVTSTEHMTGEKHCRLRKNRRCVEKLYEKYLERNSKFYVSFMDLGKKIQLTE